MGRGTGDRDTDTDTHRQADTGTDTRMAAEPGSRELSRLEQGYRLACVVDPCSSRLAWTRAPGLAAARGNSRRNVWKRVRVGGGSLGSSIGRVEVMSARRQCQTWLPRSCSPGLPPLQKSLCPPLSGWRSTRTRTLNPPPPREGALPIEPLLRQLCPADE